jgi:hypothetical protein
MKWKLIGYDTFEGEYYPFWSLPNHGEYSSEEEALSEAVKWMKHIEGLQSSEHSGGQMAGGIQDRLYIQKPDGTTKRFT